ncbi:MAG: hypothetical protein E6R13_09780 [Spirochaetes bacterium]|nr:MAG: hypothetical protein E6R13_09780 [Spirochaetota bacterium]
MNCTNCGAKLSCGCQKRIASDGRAVCGSCLATYEAGLKQIKVDISPANNKPSNVSVFYNAPKK